MRQRRRQTDDDHTKPDISLAHSPTHDDLAPLGSPFILRHEQESASFASQHSPVATFQSNYAFYGHQQQLRNTQYVSQPQQHLNRHDSAAYSSPDPERTVRQAPRPRSISASSTIATESASSGSIIRRVKRVTTAAAGSFFSPTPPDSPEALQHTQLLPPHQDSAEIYEQHLRRRRSSSRGRRPRKSQSRHHVREEVILEVPIEQSLPTPPRSPGDLFSVNIHTQFYSANPARQTPTNLQNVSHEIANTYHVYQHQTQPSRARGWSQSRFLSSANSSPITYRNHAQILSPHDPADFYNYSMYWNAEEENLLLMPTGPDSADVSLETAFVYPIGATGLTNENNLLLLPAGPASADVSLDSVEYYTPEQLARWQEEQMREIERLEYGVNDGEDDDVTLYWSSPQDLDSQAIEIVDVDKGKNVDMSQVSQRERFGVLFLGDVDVFGCPKDG